MPAKQLSILTIQNLVSARALGRGEVVQISGNMAGVFLCPRAIPLQVAENITLPSAGNPCMQFSGLRWKPGDSISSPFGESSSQVPRIVGWKAPRSIQLLKLPKTVETVGLAPDFVSSEKVKKQKQNMLWQARILRVGWAVSPRSGLLLFFLYLPHGNWEYLAPLRKNGLFVFGVYE